MKKTKAANIKVRAACITGPVHLGRGQLCQDRCRWSTRGANFVAVVSDGAGSTKYGRIGAKIVCDTLVDLLENAPFKDIRTAIVKAIGVARDKLAFHRLNSANNKKGIMAFAASSATRTKDCFSISATARRWLSPRPTSPAMSLPSRKTGSLPAKPISIPWTTGRKACVLPLLRKRTR
mgnify:CR=1 FL=1